MRQKYLEDGFVVVKDLFTQSELQKLATVANTFHSSWKKKNESFYMERAVNSAYLTGKDHLDETHRSILFGLIGSKKLMDLVNALIPEKPCFMNTQLFFDPVTKDQKNYWHRDPQYHMTIEQQMQALKGPEVIHFRIPLKNERGVELVPGTHRTWDNEEELSIRLETNGRKNHEDLDSGLAIELNAGDLLVFSANMIHRGLYGNNRMALDIIFFGSEPSIAQFVEDECLPNNNILSLIHDSSAFKNTMELKTNNKAMHATST